jgi:hypothetical protein
MKVRARQLCRRPLLKELMVSMRAQAKGQLRQPHQQPPRDSMARSKGRAKEVQPQERTLPLECQLLTKVSMV